VATWRHDRRRGHAAELHAGWPEAEAHPEEPAVSVCRATTPAVVLGSTQSEAVVDGPRAAAAGLAVARRRSGGGAVLVTLGDPVWADVWVPAGHPLWDRDVARSFDWLGDSWVRALTSVGVSGLTAHRGGYRSCTRWSSLVCFGGVGTGEVVTADGRKVVGLAQRRNRAGAWFHGACVLHWDAAPLLAALAMSEEERHAAMVGLSEAVAGVNDLLVAPGAPKVDAARVVDALIAALPPA
jgi:lipoate-protein ligase A